MIEVECNHCGCVMMNVTENLEGLLSIHCSSCDIHHEIYLSPDGDKAMAWVNAIVITTGRGENATD